MFVSGDAHYLKLGLQFLVLLYSYIVYLQFIFTHSSSDQYFCISNVVKMTEKLLT